MSSKTFSPYLENMELAFPQGKTRDTYLIPGRPDLLLVVATDRISTHNVVHKTLIPGKGEALNAWVVFWFEEILKGKVENHLVCYGEEIFEYLQGSWSDYRKGLHRRSIVVRRGDIILVEFILRAYLDGSLAKVVLSGQENPYGLKLPPDLKRMSRFEPPIFTPTEKSETDAPMLSAVVEAMYPKEVAILREIYAAARKVANSSGIDIIDTKLEFTDRLGDEWLTPDSSRYTAIVEIEEGQAPTSYDKQLVRNYIEDNHLEGKSVILPPVIVAESIKRGEELFERVSELSLDAFKKEYFGRH